MADVAVKRINSIDILRGIIMIIMALDHTRDFFSGFHNNPTDLTVASTPMFLTRWITHFCAPIFVFLSGASAYLSFAKGKSRSQASFFLLTRGIWLIVLELTLVRWGWLFSFDYTTLLVQVIWALGCSMIFLSALIFLPMPLILATGLIMILGHNAFDGLHAQQFGDNAVWWNIFHEMGAAQLTKNVGLFVIYPLVPWLGVMATGYCFGALFKKPEATRNKWLYSIGLMAIAVFIVLRYTNAYGDMSEWKEQPVWWRTVLSFINCTKYPPSLLYLLMTIGPAIALLPALEKTGNAAGRFFMVYGRVPLFYYLAHIYLIHILAIVVGLFVGVPIAYFLGADGLFGPKPNWGFSLPVVYMYWAAVILLLYLPCRWYMQVKMNNKKWWLSYL